MNQATSALMLASGEVINSHDQYEVSSTFLNHIRHDLQLLTFLTQQVFNDSMAVSSIPSI